MTESTLQIISFLKLIYVSIYALLYGLGGMYNKAFRRYVGSAFLMGGIIGFSLWLKTWSWWYLLYFPLLILASSVGYGADNFIDKVFKRLLQGFLFALTILPLAIVNHSWVLLFIHFVVCIFICIALGASNPVSARSEESLIGFSVALIPIFTIGG